MVVERKDTDKNPDTRGKPLFPKILEFEKDKYEAFSTNVEFSAELFWQMYNKRSDCENLMRRLIYD